MATHDCLRIRRVGVLLLAAALLLPAGCSLKQAAPVKQTYLLEAKRAAGGRSPAPIGPVLRVRGLRVNAPFDGRAFVYRVGDLQYATDFYHEFLVPPRTVLTEQIRQWLDASQLFGSPNAAGSKEAGLVLEGSVNALYGDYREKSAPKAVLETQVTIAPATETSGAGGVFFQRSYRREVALKEANPDALAAGWNLALEQILGALETDLKQVQWAGP